MWQWWWQTDPRLQTVWSVWSLSPVSGVIPVLMIIPLVRGRVRAGGPIHQWLIFISKAHILKKINPWSSCDLTFKSYFQELLFELSSRELVDRKDQYTNNVNRINLMKPGGNVPLVHFYIQLTHILISFNPWKVKWSLLDMCPLMYLESGVGTLTGHGLYLMSDVLSHCSPLELNSKPTKMTMALTSPGVGTIRAQCRVTNLHVHQ